MKNCAHAACDGCGVMYESRSNRDANWFKPYQMLSKDVSDIEDGEVSEPESHDEPTCGVVCIPDTELVLVSFSHHYWFCFAS